MQPRVIIKRFQARHVSLAAAAAKGFLENEHEQPLLPLREIPATSRPPQPQLYIPPRRMPQRQAGRRPPRSSILYPPTWHAPPPPLVWRPERVEDGGSSETQACL